MKTGKIERKLNVIRRFEYDDSKDSKDRMRPGPPQSLVQTIQK